MQIWYHISMSRLLLLLLLLTLFSPPLNADVIPRPQGTDFLGELGLEPLGVGRPRLRAGEILECRVRDPWNLPFSVHPGDYVQLSIVDAHHLRITPGKRTTEWEFPTPEDPDPIAPLTRWRVLIGDDESLRIAPLREPVPSGWYDTGVRGTRRECLDRIDPRLQRTPDLSLPRIKPELFEPEPMLFAH